MFGLHAHEKSGAIAAALAASRTPGQPLEPTVSASIPAGMMPGTNSVAHHIGRRIDRDQCSVGPPWRLYRHRKNRGETLMIDHKAVWYRMGGVAVPLLLFMACSPPGSAQEVGDAQAGRRLSETWCSTCHVVTADQSQSASTGAPTFRAVAAQTAITPMALAAFLQTPHHQMPDLHLSREEIGDVAAYILSLRTSTKP
jgi:mono/diheme cytochrome c family protein